MTMPAEKPRGFLIHKLVKVQDPLAVSRLERLHAFLEKENLAYYDMLGPITRERGEGREQFIDITVSVKIA